MAEGLLEEGGAPLLEESSDPLVSEGTGGQSYYIPGYITRGYFVTTTPAEPTAEGTYDLDVGVPGAARHRTAFASTRALELAYWQPGSPWSPYAVQPIFVLATHLAVYAFSDRGVPQAVEDLVMRFETSLVELDPISFRSVPLSANILGSVSSIERSQGRVVIDDPTGEWAQKVWREAICQMPAGVFWLVKQLWTVPALVGTVGHLSYTKRQLILTYGDFRRDARHDATPATVHV